MAQKDSSKSQRIQYYGSFPPPLGGVTVKNELLCKTLRDHVIPAESQLDVFDFHRSNKLSIVWNSAHGRDIVRFYGFGSTRYCMQFLKSIHRVAHRSLEHDVLVVMGGTFDKVVTLDPIALGALRSMRAILVETRGMKQSLNSFGLDNTHVFPNCREIPTITPPRYADTSNQFVFFSKITDDKGPMKLLSAARILETEGLEFSVDFWGEIDPSFEAEFTETVESLHSCRYRGIFDSASKSPASLLNHYDAMVLPSSHPHEGVPGALVEAKMAALPCIVSDINYNSEVVEDGVDGIVLSENSPEMIARAMRWCMDNPSGINRMRSCALNSASTYDISNYYDMLSGLVACR